MSTAVITFGDKSTIELHENDFLTPIVLASHNGKEYASCSKPVELENHIHDGLIPSIMTALYSCDFFYLNENHSIAYSKNAIVKIEST